MENHEHLEKAVHKKLAQKDKRKEPKMHVSGKSVFTLQNLIQKNDARLPKRRNPKNNG